VVVDMKVAAAVAVVAVVMIAVAVDPVAVVAAVEAIRICLSAADPPDLLPLQEATVGHQPFHLEFTLPMCSPLHPTQRSRLSRTSWYCQQKAR